MDENPPTVHQHLRWRAQHAEGIRPARAGESAEPDASSVRIGQMYLRVSFFESDACIGPHGPTNRVLFAGDCVL